MEKIVVEYSRILINNYTLGDCPQLEKYLSIWDKVRFCFVPIGYFYDANNMQLRIPRGISVGMIESWLNNTSVMEYNPDKHDICSIKASVLPRDDIQRDSIAFLIGEGDYKFTKKYSQLLLNLPTGTGKTYVTCAASQFFNTKILVITPIDKIKKQWKNSYLDMTDVDNDMICDIKSSATISKLMKMKKLPYKVYLVNHGTLNSYAKTNGWNAIHDLFKHLKIGVKVYDEAHLNFENTLKIDLNSNTKRTIYLTATFERSNKDENLLFSRCFNNIIRHGNTAKNKVRKHIMYLSVTYNSNPSIATQSYIITNRGWNKIRFAEYQFKNPDYFKALVNTLYYFKQFEGKIMILSTSIDLVDRVTECVKKYLPQYSVASYHSKMNDIDKEYALSCDIISTTPKSSGTGVDIHGLRTVIMTETYSSKVQAEQVSGRLREYSDTDNTFYVELIDIGFQYAYNMYKKRLPIFKNKCKKVLTINADSINKEYDVYHNEEYINESLW